MDSRNSFKTFFSLGVLTTVLLCLPQQSHAQNAIDPELQFIVAGMIDAKQHLQSAQAKILYEKVEDRPALSEDEVRARKTLNPNVIIPEPNPNFHTTINCRWFYQEGKLSMFVQRKQDDFKGGAFRQRITYDGTQVMLLQGVLQPQRISDVRGFDLLDVGVIKGPEDMFQNDFWKPWQLSWSQVDPRSYTYNTFAGLDKVLLDVNWNPVIIGKEKIYDSLCAKVQVSSKTGSSFYWIDLEHKFLIRRIQNHLYTNGKLVLRRVTEVPTLLESNGNWMPATVEISASAPGSQTETPEMKVHIKVTISDFKTGEKLPDETFVLKWPAGTQVKNKFTGETFTVKPLEPKPPSITPLPPIDQSKVK